MARELCTPNIELHATASERQETQKPEIEARGIIYTRKCCENANIRIIFLPTPDLLCPRARDAGLSDYVPRPRLSSSHATTGTVIACGSTRTATAATGAINPG